MQLEATYDRGTLTFDKPLHFSHARFRVKVELPRDEVRSAAPASEIDLSDEWMLFLKKIKIEVKAMPEEELPEVTEKQKQFQRTFALREDR